MKIVKPNASATRHLEAAIVAYKHGDWASAGARLDEFLQANPETRHLAVGTILP